MHVSQRWRTCAYIVSGFGQARRDVLCRRLNSSLSENLATKKILYLPEELLYTSPVEKFYRQNVVVVPTTTNDLQFAWCFMYKASCSRRYEQPRMTTAVNAVISPRWGTSSRLKSALPR